MMERWARKTNRQSFDGIEELLSGRKDAILAKA